MLNIPIQTIRQQKVIFDTDLAKLYEVTTKVFNQAVKRNEDRFPADFRFQLTQEEYATEENLLWGLTQIKTVSSLKFLLLENFFSNP